MNKFSIQNVKFELCNSTLQGYQEVQVVFDYKGNNYKYFVFVKEGKGVNYLKQGKKQFYKDLKSGQVARTLRLAYKKPPHSWIVAGVASVAAVSLAITMLVQSQLRWDAEQGFVLNLYANDGAFTDGSKSQIISGVKRGTKLKDISGYATKYVPSKASSGNEDYGFKNWYVDDGKDETEFHDDDAITGNLSLKANFEMVPSDPKAFDEDSWATVYNIIEQGKDKFIDTYCKDQPSYSTDKEVALMEFMDSRTNWKTVSVGNVGDYGVRLIGIGQDELYTNPDPNRPLFTFEFNECLNVTSYSYSQGGTPFYTKAGSADPDETHEYCLLKTYNESDLLPQLPDFIRNRIKTVRKRTIQINEGYEWHYDTPLQSYQFDRSCLDGTFVDDQGTPHPNKHLAIAETAETLFSLSVDEIGGRTIPFDTAKGKDTGDDLVREITQGEEYWLSEHEQVGPILDSVGEGFKKDPTHYTEPYMFYQEEWVEQGEHTDPLKRIKRYFAGDDEKGVHSQYRLRSLYIPNTKDVDVDGKDPSGNKDYRTFETFNIAENGDVGNVKASNGNYFVCGDMAWAGVNVAPAFCL